MLAPERLRVLLLPWAYVGPGPGLRLVPYSLALLALIALALGAILVWPIYLLVMRFRRGREALQDSRRETPKNGGTHLQAGSQEQD